MNADVERNLKMALVTTATMVVSSTFHSGSPWSGWNAMATIVPGEPEPKIGFDPKRTLLGGALAFGGLFVWGLASDALFRAAGQRPSKVTRGVMALAGLAIDRLVLPKHLLPNFVKTMGIAGTIGKYRMMARVGGTD